MNYEEVLNKYTFINEIKCPHGEEVEVTEEAIQIYHEYDIYKKDWKVHEYNKPRNQMSTGGAWLYKENENTINIAGDILTAKSAFPYEYLKDKDVETLELYNLFERIYHSLGNCIPWCEGANLGGGNYKYNDKYYGSCDFFTRKLNACKGVFDGNNKKKYRDTNIVACRINQKKYLGRGVCNYTCLQFWIEREWINKNRNWGNFVKEHYLIDMVDENFDPIPFFVINDGRGNNLGEESDVIKMTLIQSIKLIIRRGYRIHNGIKEPFNDGEDKKVQEIFSNLGL